MNSSKQLIEFVADKLKKYKKYILIDPYPSDGFASKMFRELGFEAYDVSISYWSSQIHFRERIKNVSKDKCIVYVNPDFANYSVVLANISSSTDLFKVIVLIHYEDTFQDFVRMYYFTKFHALGDVETHKFDEKILVTIVKPWQ